MKNGGTAKYYINDTADFSVVSEIRCKVRKFPEKEEVYGIKCYHDDKEVVQKIYKIPTYKFVLRRYWYFALALGITSILCFLSMPVAMILSFAFFAVFYKIFKPYSSELKARKAHRYFHFLSVFVAISIFYLIFFGDNYRKSLEYSQGLFYGLLINYTLFYFVGLFHKYGEIYAMKIDDVKNWTIAQTFVWRTKYD